MTVGFAMKWALGMLGLFLVVFIADIEFRIVPGWIIGSTTGGAMAFGLIYGAVLVGPIVWVSLKEVWCGK